jgi:hypothetical protein
MITFVKRNKYEILNKYAPEYKKNIRKEFDSCELIEIADKQKKYFISERFQCIINKLVKSIVMSFKSNSVQVVCLSVLGFCAGVFLTCVLITARRPDSRHGVGGLETTAEPEYEENLSSLLAEVDAKVHSSNA